MNRDGVVFFIKSIADRISQQHSTISIFSLVTFREPQKSRPVVAYHSFPHSTETRKSET